VNVLLITTDHPDSPVNVEVRRCDPTVAEIAWQPASDNNEPILDYTVQYNTSTDPPDVRHEGAVVDADARLATIPLRPWARYSFRVTARNGLGVGRPSRPTPPVCQTPPAKPFRNPDDVCSNLTGSLQLIILWQVCLLSAHHFSAFTCFETVWVTRLFFVKLRFRRKIVAHCMNISFIFLVVSCIMYCNYHCHHQEPLLLHNFCDIWIWLYCIWYTFCCTVLLLYWENKRMYIILGLYNTLNISNAFNSASCLIANDDKYA